MKGGKKGNIEGERLVQGGERTRRKGREGKGKGRRLERERERERDVVFPSLLSQAQVIFKVFLLRTLPFLTEQKSVTKPDTFQYV